MNNIGEDLIKGIKEAIGYMRGKKGQAIHHKVVVKNALQNRDRQGAFTGLKRF